MFHGSAPSLIVDKISFLDACLAKKVAEKLCLYSLDKLKEGKRGCLFWVFKAFGFFKISFIQSLSCFGINNIEVKVKGVESSLSQAPFFRNKGVFKTLFLFL
ncbi:hypothetical protein ES703_112222 [subsurface metagenome]